MFRLVSMAVLSLFPRRSVDGTIVIFSDLDTARDEWTARIGETLSQIESVDPRWRRAIRRLVRHVVIWPGDFISTTSRRGIQVPSSYLSDVSVTQLASMFVHEATHLRIAKYDAGNSPHRRARIERICVRQQSDFLQRFGVHGQGLAEKLAEALETEWWTDAAREHNAARLLNEHGLPRWMAIVQRRLHP